MPPRNWLARGGIYGKIFKIRIVACLFIFMRLLAHSNIVLFTTGQHRLRRGMGGKLDEFAGEKILSLCRGSLNELGSSRIFWKILFLFVNELCTLDFKDT